MAITRVLSTPSYSFDMLYDMTVIELDNVENEIKLAIARHEQDRLAQISRILWMQSMYQNELSGDML